MVLWIFILLILNSFVWIGRAPPRNTTVDLNSGNIDVPPNMTSWASFHNGVAAGLKIAPASQIDSAWIVYNKPKHAELANEYAGFLMALGLNGHLTKLATLNIHDYLTKVRTCVLACASSGYCKQLLIILFAFTSTFWYLKIHSSQSRLSELSKE